ncbi:hypothetical protein C0431_05180 [bacterium]|jgi:predicted Zn-dependent protease|nr:hypothetical protein [bacterium]
MKNLKSLSGLTLLLVAGMASASQFGPNNQPDLIQPKLREMLRTANTAMLSGDYERAIAYSNSVLVDGDIKFSVNTDGIPDAQRAEARAAADQAIALWSEALNGEVNFVEVEPRKANVRINFQTEVRNMGTNIAGFAVWQRQVFDWGNNNFTSNITADIKLRSQTPTGRLMPKDAMVHTAAHEIGHVLGLWDSPTFGDIMGPLYLKSPVTKLSERELTAFREARSEAKQITQACLVAKTR